MFILLCGVVAAGYMVYNQATEERFALTGTVEVPEKLKKSAQAQNTTCSIIVKNEGDVPIAIKRVINPTFPLSFRIDKEDLLISEWEGLVKVEVEINSHGNLGVLKSGDIFGAADGAFEPNTKDIMIMADKRTGTPQALASGRARGSFFRTAAR